jgi:signal transduction histidine kinase
MMHRIERHAAWFTGWLLVALIGSVLLAQSELTRLRETFETETRVALRLLNQRVAQNDVVLSTLTLLRPASEQVHTEQRLPAVYPQILSVQRRAMEETWPNAQLLAAEAESHKQHRAVLSGANFAKGRYQLVLGAQPASYALLVDMRNMVPWSEWPMPPDASPVRMTLEYAGQTFVLQPGVARDDSRGGWQFAFNRVLDTESQPFDVVADRRVGWVELPWALMLSWTLLVAVVMLGTRALLRQRKDRRRAEELLRVGQVARLTTLGELAAGMAHELNQPLTAMLINAQVARRVLHQDPPDLLTAQLAVKEAVEQAERASDVVRRLRHAVAQPDMGAQMQKVDLQELARKALNLLDPELRRRSITPDVKLVGPAFKVRAEPVALEQIVHNLLLNALQALDQTAVGERRLFITLNTDGKSGQLSVSDTGPGIRSEVLSHVFEPFFTTRDGGLGLGLSLSESLARGMGGTLMAFNRSPHGAEFCLSLPLASLE